MSLAIRNANAGMSRGWKNAGQPGAAPIREERGCYDAYCLTLNVAHYILRSVIGSSRSKETEKVFRREFSRRFNAIARVAKRKLDHLHAATSLADLAAMPGNRLEALVGDRAGQYSQDRQGFGKSAIANEVLIVRCTSAWRS